MALQPTLAKVIASLPPDKTRLLHEYAQKRAFHRGRQWFGTGMKVASTDRGVLAVVASMSDVACPVGAAFKVERDASRTGWYSAKVDENLLAAIKHIVEVAGGEEGMEQYLKELENSDPVELHSMIESQYQQLV